jgi:sulfide:quinone oxidoreductase
MTTETTRSEGAHVVVVGGGFAGLGAAFTLRKRLPEHDRITVVAPSPFFIFSPSLIWTPFSRSITDASFELGPALNEMGIELVTSYVRKVDVAGKTLTTDDGEMHFDRLVITTGGRPDTERIPGLAGEFRSASWIVGEDSAMEVGTVFDRLVETPGPLVIGSAPDASYYSAAYELALLIDEELRRREVRDHVPLTFVTAEPSIGDLGFGQRAARPVLEALLARRGIATRTGAGIDHVSPGVVALSTGEVLPVQASIIMPPFTGAVDIWKSAGLTDGHGFVPITETYRHTRFPQIYAAGIAARFIRPVSPLGTIRPPHTGYLSTQMGRIAAENLAADMGYGKPAPRAFPNLLDFRIIDGGSGGALLTSRGEEQLQHTAQELMGTTAHELKESAEQFLIWRLRTGHVDDLGKGIEQRHSVTA